MLSDMFLAAPGVLAWSLFLFFPFFFHLGVRRMTAEPIGNSDKAARLATSIGCEIAIICLQESFTITWDQGHQILEFANSMAVHERAPPAY